MDEATLSEAAQRFCRETYDMEGAKDDYHEKFGVLICFIKDILVPKFGSAGVSEDFKEVYKRLLSIEVKIIGGRGKEDFLDELFNAVDDLAKFVGIKAKIEGK